MPEFYFSTEHDAFVKECTKCLTIYVGHKIQERAEYLLSRMFATDTSKADGFYSKCKQCVAKANQVRRDGRDDCDPEQLLITQERKCAICKGEICLTRKNRIKTKAYVDHDHETGAVRGLLCHRCNCRLGSIEDTEFLNLALEYLQRFKCES